MLTLENNRLTIRFPEVHKDATCTIEFQRTLRIPDDNRTHKLPPGLGAFPLKHVDDHADKLPAAWHKRGGVFLPMHDTEAMWIKFNSRYPFAVKIAAGKINAVTGEAWTPELRGPLSRQRPVNGPRHFGDLSFGETGLVGSSHAGMGGNVGGEQDYVVLPRQNWLDGFCTEKGKIRQFVAKPMGEGYTVEEQITGEAVHGGLQIIVYPLKPEHYRPNPTSALRSMSLGGSAGTLMFSAASASASSSISASASADIDWLSLEMERSAGPQLNARSVVKDMGMAPGGLMEQTIYEDDYGLEKFDQSVSAKCFVHLLNAQHYEVVTGQKPPHRAPTASDYTKHGLPWFQEQKTPGAKALPGGKPLQKLDSVANLANKLGHGPLHGNDPLPVPPKVVTVKTVPGQVREGDF